MISAELDSLYRNCLDCERQHLDFVQTSKNNGVCATPNSLRDKVDELQGKKPAVPPDIARDQERQKQIQDQVNAKESAILEKMRSDRLRQAPESGVSGSSRAPGDKSADELARLNAEMQAIEARQKDDDRRRTEREAAKLEMEMRQMESDAKRPSPRPAEAASSDFGPNVVVFALRSSYKFRIQASFYSQGRNHEWPGGGEAYALNDSQLHKYRLSCQPGEKICFGAWATGSASPYWGVGPDDKHGCEDCCATCGSTTVHGHNLVYTGGGESSSSGISAADLLGAAIGIAGIAAGSSGSANRATPRYSPGPPPRNRESGVSGGR
ncbi:hypothetical protein [Bradyrhizobium sp. Arg816]|uniref:hypothetical protein n=1 Tax=Bradyrhizobium sp. Arg816 TaxID=2998491 RepID=UPI00249F5BB2|nr:hypothetical protein [Bradyrhizobium sp. Arg816]MDI3561209.1 hypothetical protein [Bradyrhizobium sp. Arg816]